MNIATSLITGANRGIGRALVEEALRRGVQTVYAGTRGPWQHSDQRVMPLTLDVTNATQTQQAVTEIGSLDVLINNAGIAMYDDLSKPDVIEQHLAVNLFGPLNVTRAFLPLLKRSKGAVVNNLSTSALAALPIIPGYSISKATALSMTQSLRALLAGQGVTVHASDCGARGNEQRLRSGTTCQYGQTGEGCSKDRGARGRCPIAATSAARRSSRATRPASR